MRGDDHLVFIPQQALRQFHPHAVRFGGRDLAGGIGVNQVVALHAAFLSPTVLGAQHILQGCVKLAVDGGGKLGAPIR